MSSGCLRSHHGVTLFFFKKLYGYIHLKIVYNLHTANLWTPKLSEILSNFRVGIVPCKTHVTSHYQQSVSKSPTIVRLTYCGQQRISFVFSRNFLASQYSCSCERNTDVDSSPTRPTARRNRQSIRPSVSSSDVGKSL